MRFKHRALSLLLSMVMVLSYMPAFTFAEIDGANDTETSVMAEEQAKEQVEEQVEEQAEGPTEPEQDATVEPGMTVQSGESSESEEEQKPEAEPKEDSTEGKIASAGQIKAVPGVDTAGNDELLEQYFDMEVDKALGKKTSGSGILKARRATRYSKLNPVEQHIYDEILSMMQSVAHGSVSEASIQINLSEQLEPFYDEPNPYEDYDHSITTTSLGIDAAVYKLYVVDEGSYWDFTDEAKAALYDIEKVVDAVLADNPADTYWFDKEAGYRYGPNFCYESDQDVSDIFFDGAPTLTISFNVAEAYSGDSENPLIIDVSKTALLTAAVNKVNMILSENGELNDIDKLHAFKDAICELTEYDHTVTEETPYGDPWQLIYVFDDNESTKVVCEGYSKAFQYLCDKTVFSNSDIDCHTVTGNMIDGTGEELHMWNILHMDDGKNYMADITNSDDGNVGENGELFIAPAFEGSVDVGYGYMDANEDEKADVTYVYDDDTRRIYDDEELEMSMTAYEGADEPDFEETIIPLSLDEQVSFNSTQGKNYQVYSFTPEEDGYYCFGSFGTSDCIGYRGFMEEGIFYETERVYSWEEGNCANLYFDASAGQTVYLKTEAISGSEEGDEGTFEVRVTKSSRVESIELNLSAQNLSICEYTQGYWNVDNNGNKTWNYNFPGFTDGDTLTVTDGNGSVVYSYEYGYFRAEGKADIILNYSNDQWENGEWEIGVHEFVFSYRGATTAVPVEITASPIESVAFTPAKPKVYVEGVDGSISTDWYNEEYTYYGFPEFNDGDRLTVDGKDYVFSWRSYQFVSEGGDVIEPNDIEMLDSNQYEYHWGIGSHEFEIGYMGKFASYPVEVIENPVRNIEYIPASPYIYYEGCNTYRTETDGENVEHYLYLHPRQRKGDQLIINGTDTYTVGEEGQLIGPDGNYLDSEDLRFSSEQENGEYWEVGSSNYVTVTYWGRSCTLPVTVVEATAEEISYQPAEDYVLIDNVDGYYRYKYEGEDAGTEWFFYREPCAESGDVLTLGDKQYTFRNGSFISADGERIDSAEVVFTTDQGPDNQWSIDDENDHSVTISYRGSSCTVPVAITASPVTDIEFEPEQPYRFYEHAGGYWDDDDFLEEGGEMDYYYELPEYCPDDKLTVYKGEESTVYTFRYDKNARRSAFFTADSSDMIYPGDIERTTSQDDGDLWQVGEQYEVIVSYMGASCSIGVTVEANPVESIDYEPAGGALSIMEGVDGYWEWDDDSYDAEKYFRYYPPEPQEGDRLTLQMVSGDETVYEFIQTDSEGYFAETGNTGNRLDMQYLNFRLDQYEKWNAGETYECTVEYMGSECMANVTIAENPVSGFTVTLAEPLRIKDSALDQIGQEDDEVNPADYLDGWNEETGLFRTGDYISVTTPLGIQRYTLREGNDYFDNGNGDRIYCYEIEYWSEGEWIPGGDPQVVMSYMGREIDPVSVEIYPDPNHIHSMVHHDAVEATCLTGGYAEFWYCSGCDRYYSDEDGQNVMTREEAILNATGHIWDKGTVTKEASCSEEGEMIYTCSACDETRTQSIPTTEHSWVEGEVVEPSTCTRYGTRTYICSVCEANKIGRIPLAPHDLVHADAHEPTCEESGNVEYWSCTNCGKSFSDENAENEITVTYLSPVPHVLTEHPAKAATCEQDGHEAYWTCDNCGAVFSDAQGADRIDAPVIIGATGHAWGDWELTTAPTCTERGVETRVCANDSTHKETRYTDALGHDWAGEPEYEWTADNSYVTAKVTCSRDASHELTEKVHTSYTDTATCTEAGARTYTAEFSNALFATQTKEVPSQALGHDYQIVPNTALAAGCEKEGRTADRQCTRCGDLIEGEATPALEHNYQNVPGTAVAAGCETEGRTADRQCTRCGDLIEGEVTPALEHDYQIVPGTAIAAGCETEGKHANRKCSRCGDVIIGEVTAPLNHDPQKIDAKAATCTVNGNIEYWKCNRCGKLFRDAEGTIEISEADTVIAAGDHIWGEPVFTFSEGGGSATATRICINDGSHQQTVEAVVTSEITKVATATETGEITYTATAVFDEQEYTATKIVEANTYQPQMISQLSAVGDTNKIRLAWTRSHEVNSEIYCIYRREALTDQNQLIKKIYSREKLEYTDEDVETGKKYTYYVTCLNGFGQESAPSPEATAAAMKDEEAPAVVQMSPAENALIGGKQKITAKATDNVQVISMTLEASTDKGSSWQQIAQTEGSVISMDLDTASYPSGEISIRAVAYDAAGNAAEPFVSSYVIDNDGPSQVKNLTAEATSSSVTLKWDDNTENDIRYYRVEQISDGGEIKKIEDVNALGVILNGLKSSAEYTYQVTAYDILGNRGVPSESVTVTTSSDDISPSVVSIKPDPSYVGGLLEVTVTAKDNMGLDSVIIQYSVDKLSWSDLDEVKIEGSPQEATASGTIDTDSLTEGSLFVRAKVTDTSGNENDYLRMEPVEYLIDRTKPAKVTGLSAEAGSGSISLSWTASEEEDVKGYNVYRSENGGDFALITKAGKNSAVDHTANEAGKTYTYKVAAVDTAGNIGDLSDGVSAEATADTEPPVINTYEPAAGSQIGPGKKTFTILLSDNTELANARITYTVDSADGESDITEEQTLYENGSPGDYYLNVTGELPVDELANGDVISIHVYAADTSGNELAGSNAINYTVDKTAPSVHNVTAELKGQDVELHISGDRITDLSGYYIYRREAGGEREYIGSAGAGSATDYDPYLHSEYTDTNTEAGKTYIYIAVAYDSCGNTSYRESEEIIIPEQTILTAQLTCDDVIEGDVEYYFSGINSESSLGIKEFSFDFGDGSEPVTGEDARVVHRYEEPDEDDEDGTDTYTVSLTITDNAGNTDTVERRVKVKRQALAGKVTVTVVSPNGAPLSNVPVYFDMDRTLERIKRTDGKGQVQFVSDAGMYAIGAYTSGYLPIRRTMTVNANMENEITLTLTEKEIVSGKFEVSRLTLDEIRELGINTSDPDSMHYAKINVTLEYGEIEVVVDKYGFIKEVIKEAGKINIFPKVKPSKKPPIDWPDSDGGGGGGSDGGPGGGFMNCVPEIPFVAVLEVPVETSFLKEFFDVRLHLINNATSEFEITDNMVTLDVPNGMTLLDLEQTDGAVVRFDSLSGQETRTIDWCLRGDDAGEYTLAADYSGVLRNFAADVTGRFESSEPVKVMGISAGKVIMEVDPHIQYGAFYTKISLQNVGDADMYLPSIGIVDDLIFTTESYGENGQEVTVKDEKKVRLLNEYLEDDAGYTQAIPPGGVEVLTKGQMLSRRYACYDTIRTEDIAELKRHCASIAEGYGIGFEFRVRQHNLYDTEEGDPEAAEAKRNYILGKDGMSAYQWVTDYGNNNFYYYIQSIMSREDFSTAFAIETHRTLSLGLKLDLDLFTNESIKETTDKYILEIIRDEKYVEQVDERLLEDYLGITSDVIDVVLGKLKSSSAVSLSDAQLKDVESLLKQRKNLRKLSMDLRAGEPNTFLNRVSSLIISDIPDMASEEVAELLRSEQMPDEVVSQYRESVTSSVESLGTMVSSINTLITANSDSMAVYNRLMMMRASKEETEKLLDIILSVDRNSIDPAVYDEVKKLRKDLDDEYLNQQQLFLAELGKIARDEAAGKVTHKVISLLDDHFFKGATAGPIASVYAIAGLIFGGVDYALGWGDSVELARNIQVAADLTKAVRDATSAAENNEDPEYFLTCLKYLIKLRLLGEKCYIEAAKQEEENQGILNMIKDDYAADYEDLDEYYRVFKEKLLSYRDSLFRDVEGTVDTPYAPQAGIDYAAETTLQKFSSEYEYSFGGSWTDCSGEAIELSPGTVSRDLRIRRKADGTHPTGNAAYVAVPPRPEIRGDAVCKYMSVKGSDSVYVLTGVPDGAYYYEFTDNVNLDELGPDAEMLTVSGGTAEITDSTGHKSPYIAIRKPAVVSGSGSAFESAVRTIAAEEIKSGDINVVEVAQEADVTAVAEEFQDEAAVVTVREEGTTLAETAAQSAEDSDVTAASVLEQLKDELAGKEGSGVTQSTRAWDVRLVMQTYLDMKVTEVKADEEGSDIKSIVVDITPMSRIIASTKGIEDQDIKIGTNAVLVGDAQVLDMSGQKTKLQIKLPACFNNEAGIVYVLHNNKEEYAAQIITRDNETGEITIEFETDGFSPFKVSLEPETFISLGGVGYTSLSAAIEAAKNGDTITLSGDVNEEVTVSGKNLTINCGSYDANVVAGEKTVVTREGNKENGDLVIKIHYHSPHKVDAVPATYKGTGTAEHWECSCGAVFSDEEGLNEIAPESIQTPSLKDTYTAAASTSATDTSIADTKVNEANTALANGVPDEETDGKVTAADTAADTAVASANAALEAAEKALDAAQGEDEKAEAQTLVIAAKKLVADASSTKAASQKAVARIAELRADAAKDAAASQTKGTQEAVDAAQAALDAANAAETAAKAAKDAAQDAVDAAKAAAQAAGVDPEEDSAYIAAKEVLEEAETAANNAADAVTAAESVLRTAKNDKAAADAASKPSVTPPAAPPAPTEILDLPAVKISKPKAAKKKLTVKWKKVSKKNLKKISGIQIEVATDPGFTNIVKTATAGKKKTSKKIGGLQPKTKYYVRIRAYGAANHYSVWKSKSAKVK